MWTEPLSDTGLILGLTTCLDDEETLLDLYPREVLIEAGLIAPSRKQVRKQNRQKPVVVGPNQGVGLFAGAPSWLHTEVTKLAKASGRSSGTLATISSTECTLWSKDFDKTSLAIRGSFWASIRYSSSDLHFWDIESLLGAAVNTGSR